MSRRKNSVGLIAIQLQEVLPMPAVDFFLVIIFFKWDLSTLDDCLPYFLKAWFFKAMFWLTYISKGIEELVLSVSMILLNFLLSMYFKAQIYIGHGLILVNVFTIVGNSNASYYCHWKARHSFMPKLWFWLFIWSFI